MKKIFVVFGMLSAAALWMPSTGFAKLLPLDIPPILAAKNSCKQYAGCPNGPCFPGCNNPCKTCNLTCQNYAGCPNGPCYPGCPNPCVSCCSATCDPCNPTACTNPCKTCTATFHNINDTGITFGATYPSGNNATCTGTTVTAQDCSKGRDSVAPTNDGTNGRAGFSFTKLTGGCVKDNVTGLTWSPDKGAVTWGNWSSILTTANSGSGLCGLTTGWRIPTVRELLSIVSYHGINNAVDADYFSNAAPTYWSDTASASNTNNAWAVLFSNGSTTTLSKTMTPYGVRLVNGAKLSADLIGKANGTVVDRTTGLMWKRCLEGFSWNGTTCTALTTPTVNWGQALALAGGSFAGITGWRLPNIKELQSIVKESQNAPALDTTKFPNIPAGGSQVWSSSPYAGITSKSWMVDFASGIVSTPLSRESVLYVRLVRDCISTECNPD